MLPTPDTRGKADSGRRWGFSREGWSLLSSAVHDHHVHPRNGAQHPVEHGLAEPTAVPGPLAAAHDDVRDAVFLDERGDGTDHVALAAWCNGNADMIVGVARFVRLRKGGDTAEAAVAVVDHMQRRGIAWLLLSHLAEAARERGILRFRAEVLSANHAVRALLRDLVKATPVAVDGNIVYDVEVPAVKNAMTVAA